MFTQREQTQTITSVGTANNNNIYQITRTSDSAIRRGKEIDKASKRLSRLLRVLGRVCISNLFVGGSTLDTLMDLRCARDQTVMPLKPLTAVCAIDTSVWRTIDMPPAPIGASCARNTILIVDRIELIWSELGVCQEWEKGMMELAISIHISYIATQTSMCILKTTWKNICNQF